MAKFYVWRGRRILWNILVLTIAVALLVWVFNVEETEIASGDEEQQLQEIRETSSVFAVLDEPEPVELASMVEPVIVRPVPTKFSEYRLERERLRSRQMELLQNIAYDGTAAPEQRQKAQEQLQQVLAVMAVETEIENLLKAKGYVDGVAIIDGEFAIVVVPVRLTREEAAQIGELVRSLTGINYDQITIVDEPSAV
ncbi:MAG: SpoIIIAH-like family protein [Firmicutes bacterium]|nr:SpoIIIAH-like family protein [Bacillota bacterium]